MSSSEEDSYTMIYASLKHPIRRKILRTLSYQPQTFSDLQKQFKLESPHLTYHIEGLGNLLYKTEDGKYALSSLGEGAVSMMRNVEEPPNTSRFPFINAHSNQSGKRVAGRAVAIALGIICIVLAATLVGAFAYYVQMVNSKNNTISSLNSQVSNLQNQTNSDNASIANLQDQIDSMKAQIAELTVLALSENATIAGLNSTLASLNARMTSLTNELNQFEMWVLNETSTLLNQTQMPTAQGSNNGLQLTMTLQKTLFRLGEPINITFTITNISNQTVNFGYFPSYWDFLVYNDTDNGLYEYQSSGIVFPMYGTTYTLNPGISIIFGTRELGAVWPQTCNATTTEWGEPTSPVSPGTYFIIGYYGPPFGHPAYQLQTTPIQITILPF